MTFIHESLLEARMKEKKRRIFIASLIVKHSKNEKTKKRKKKRELSLRSVNVSFS